MRSLCSPLHLGATPFGRLVGAVWHCCSFRVYLTLWLPCWMGPSIYGAEHRERRMSVWGNRSDDRVIDGFYDQWGGKQSDLSLFVLIHQPCFLFSDRFDRFEVIIFLKWYPQACELSNTKLHVALTQRQRGCHERVPSKCDLADTSVNISEHVTERSRESETETDGCVHADVNAHTRMCGLLCVSVCMCVSNRCFAGMVLSCKCFPNPSPIPGLHTPHTPKTQCLGS